MVIVLVVVLVIIVMFLLLLVLVLFFLLPSWLLLDQGLLRSALRLLMLMQHSDCEL